MPGIYDPKYDADIELSKVVPYNYTMQGCTPRNDAIMDYHTLMEKLAQPGETKEFTFALHMKAWQRGNSQAYFNSPREHMEFTNFVKAAVVEKQGAVLHANDVWQVFVEIDEHYKRRSDMSHDKWARRYSKRIFAVVDDLFAEFKVDGSEDAFGFATRFEGVCVADYSYPCPWRLPEHSVPVLDISVDGVSQQQLIDTISTVEQGASGIDRMFLSWLGANVELFIENGYLRYGIAANSLTQAFGHALRQYGEESHQLSSVTAGKLVCQVLQFLKPGQLKFSNTVTWRPLRFKDPWPSPPNRIPRLEQPRGGEQLPLDDIIDWLRHYANQPKQLQFLLYLWRCVYRLEGNTVLTEEISDQYEKDYPEESFPIGNVNQLLRKVFNVNIKQSWAAKSKRGTKAPYLITGVELHDAPERPFDTSGLDI